MAQVAILGTEGAGKTVLMAVMAWVFRHERKGIRLIPATAQTSQHVAKIWTYIQEGGWPPSNPEGQLRELKWELEINGSPNCTLRFLEISGQDFRGLFGQDQFVNVESLPAHKQELARHVHSADIVCFLVNLGDFIGESDISRREESQWALKAALDSVKGHPWPKRCSIVITKADQFEAAKNDTGSWKALAERHLPYVYGAHLKDGAIPIHAVSAVGNTVVGINSLGEPCRVPDKKIRCHGLVALLSWVGESAKALGCQHDQPGTVGETPNRQEPVGPPPLPTGAPSSPAVADKRNRFWQRELSWGWVVPVLLLISALIRGCS